jgi:MoaA/NifB/PqqE/SkfB family radical SAM enzyme
MNPRINAIYINEQPFIAIWEVTQACDLACVHCCVSAQPVRHPLERFRSGFDGAWKTEGPAGRR